MKKLNIFKFSFNLSLPASIKQTLLRKHLHLVFLDSVCRRKAESSRKNSTDNTYELFEHNFSKMLSTIKQRHDNKKTIDTPNASEYF